MFSLSFTLSLTSVRIVNMDLENNSPVIRKYQDTANATIIVAAKKMKKKVFCS